MAALFVLAPLAQTQWRTVTVYDVLPEDCRFSIGNNDVGNVPGDMYFNVKDKYLPVACDKCLKDGPTGCRTPTTFDCTNPESTGNLVVRKLEVEVLGDFGDGYQLCDVWPHSKACQYTCIDPHFGHTKPGVGMESVCASDHEASFGKCNMAPKPSFMHKDAWDFWNYNTAALFGDTGKGEWYSLVSADEGKYWRNATVLKVINKQCQARQLDALVTKKGAECFVSCPQPTNQSSACWINCFFTTVLGPEADTKLKPAGSQTGAMAVDDLAEAWLSGFASEDPDAGGCPPCPAAGSCPDPLAAQADGGSASPARPAPRPYVSR